MQNQQWDWTWSRVLCCQLQALPLVPSPQTVWISSNATAKLYTIEQAIWHWDQWAHQPITTFNFDWMLLLYFWSLKSPRHNESANKLSFYDFSLSALHCRRTGKLILRRILCYRRQQHPWPAVLRMKGTGEIVNSIHGPFRLGVWCKKVKISPRKSIPSSSSIPALVLTLDSACRNETIDENAVIAY
jgi:hypothetical protein